MTYIQIINSVLRRLREDTVTSYDLNDYSTLIGDYVNETKREVEDAWNWTQLRTNLPVTTAASDNNYTLSGSGERYRILQVINDTQDTEMRQVPYTWINRQNDIGTSSEGSPMYYTITGATSGDADVTIYPTPSGIETLNFYAVVPQDDLTDSSTVLSVPSMPVILGAYAKAISERGEDGGQQYAEVMNAYRTALSDAIGIDAGNAYSELNWTVN